LEVVPKNEVDEGKIYWDSENIEVEKETLEIKDTSESAPV
jgi:hypothetical protein